MFVDVNLRLSEKKKRSSCEAHVGSTDYNAGFEKIDRVFLSFGRLQKRQILISFFWQNRNELGFEDRGETDLLGAILLQKVWFIIPV